MATENYLLSIQGSVSGQYNECVLCFQSAGLSSVDTLGEGGDLINSFIAHGQALWLAMMPASYFLDVLQARRAFPKPSAVAHAQNQNFAVPGTRGSNATSYNLCPAIFLIPPMGTKSGGRTFLPAVAQGDVVNNTYLAAYLTAINNFFTAAIAGFAGSGTNWHLAIFSRKNVSASLVASFSPSLRLGFQGKRRKPVGSA
jgi:hypothetical protein